LLEYAESKALADSQLYEKDKKGITLLETLETVERMTNRRPKQLDDILSSIKPFPHEMADLWQAFMRMSQRRTIGMQANRLTYSDILNYCIITNSRFTQFEIETIEKLDEIILNGSRN
jgi:hypothetical protein